MRVRCLSTIQSPCLSSYSYFLSPGLLFGSCRFWKCSFYYFSGNHPSTWLSPTTMGWPCTSWRTKCTSTNLIYLLSRLSMTGSATNACSSSTPTMLTIAQSSIRALSKTTDSVTSCSDAFVRTTSGRMSWLICTLAVSWAAQSCTYLSARLCILIS